jgi:hypothetical protein
VSHGDEFHGSVSGSSRELDPVVLSMGASMLRKEGSSFVSDMSDSGMRRMLPRDRELSRVLAQEESDHMLESLPQPFAPLPIPCARLIEVERSSVPGRATGARRVVFVKESFMPFWGLESSGCRPRIVEFDFTGLAIAEGTIIWATNRLGEL